MRHGKKFNHLGRQAPHRKAMLSNMCASLILHKRISTTLAKAKELRKKVEPLLTRAKEDTTHNRRMAFSVLQDKEAIKILFGEISEKVGSRPGGYTRIIKTGYRLGDNAEMCIIELVDYNELMLKDSKPAKKTTRRSRRGTGKSEAEGTADASPKAEAAAEKKAPKAKAEKEEAVDETAAAPVAEAPEAAPDAEEKADATDTQNEDKKGE
ncbi:MAG TPA: 50S ribosomal protein L17, partial [Cyclobacteriaceae bacterium]|nr:50S ribosomal protein L17 [Cyclobacteriaceae bacterium]